MPRRHTDWRLIMSLGTIVLIILVIALLGGFSGLGGGPFYGTGYYGGGGLGLILVILLNLVLIGRILRRPRRRCERSLAEAWSSPRGQAFCDEETRRGSDRDWSPPLRFCFIEPATSDVQLQ